LAISGSLSPKPMEIGGAGEIRPMRPNRRTADRFALVARK